MPFIADDIAIWVPIAIATVGFISGYQQAEASKAATKTTKQLTREELAQEQSQYESTMAYNQQKDIADAQQKALDRKWQQKEFDQLYGPQGFYTKQLAQQKALEQQQMQNLYGIPTGYTSGADYWDYLTSQPVKPNPYYK